MEALVRSFYVNFPYTLCYMETVKSSGSECFIFSKYSNNKQHLQCLQSLQVGLFTPDRNIIITNLDAQTIDLEPFQYTGANITLFRVIDPDRPIQEHKNIEDVLSNEKVKCDDYNNCTPEDIEGTYLYYRIMPTINRDH